MRSECAVDGVHPEELRHVGLQYALIKRPLEQPNVAVGTDEVEELTAYAIKPVKVAGDVNQSFSRLSC